jgi:UDP-glucuronate 4-epimerase
VTGAAGFVGFHVVRRLALEGHDLLAVDSFEDNYSVDLKRARWNELTRDAGSGAKVQQRHLDLCDYDSFTRATDGFAPDAILHFAARPGVREGTSAWPRYARSNLTGLSSVLSVAAEAASSPVLVYASSSSVYGGAGLGESREEDEVHPISFYGATKAAGEQLVALASKTQGLSAVGLRMFTVYGPWGRPDMLPWRLIRAAQTGRPLPLYGDGSARRDFTHIDDVVESVARIIRYSRGIDRGFHEVFNIGGGQSLSVREAIREVESATGSHIQTAQLEVNKSDVTETLASTEKLESVVGFAPSIDFATGIRKTIPWFKSALVEGHLNSWD